MQNKSKREQLPKVVQEYLNLLDKKKAAKTEDEKKHYSELAHAKYQECKIEEFGDRNVERFSRI